jgi:transcription initiation factor TFIIB
MDLWIVSNKSISRSSAIVKDESLKEQRASSRTLPPKPDGSLITDPETGEIINIETGQVIQENSFLHSNEGKIELAGAGMSAPFARHDGGSSTIIGRANRDAGGNVLTADMRAGMERLRLWDSRSQSSSFTERNLQRVFGMLARIKDRMALSEPMIEKTAYIYRKAQKKG